jgi:hypothetical protein
MSTSRIPYNYIDLSNVGKRWTGEEEETLLEELSKNMDINLIALNHKRKIGGINARRKEIAYVMYSNNNTMEDIIMKTKLVEAEILEIIEKRGNFKKQDEKEGKQDEKDCLFEREIAGMKNDIIEIKNTLKELVENLKINRPEYRPRI